MNSMTRLAFLIVLMFMFTASILLYKGNSVYAQQPEKICNVCLEVGDPSSMQSARDACDDIAAEGYKASFIRPPTHLEGCSKSSLTDLCVNIPPNGPNMTCTNEDECWLCFGVGVSPN